MSCRRRISALVLALVATAGARELGAQRWCNTPGAEPPSYTDCALRVDGDVLVRGAHGETIAMADKFSPLPLRRFVTGDSAVKYATSYERDGWRAGTIRLIGAALLLGGSFTSLAQNRGPTDQRRFIRSTGGRLMMSGGAVYLLSIPFRLRADREADRAVWWNNSRLPKP